MVPSPRRCAASTATATTATTAFTTTWDDSDAAFFDPSALPLAKIPRGWERRQEVRRTGHGKEKKIWRRFNLRSRADKATPEEQDGEEEHDARSRAVKRRQHMSPRAMEKTTGRLNGKKRAFKATRWDRRKSVLPRKRAAPTVDFTAGADIETSRTGEDTFETIQGEDETDQTTPRDHHEEMQSIHLDTQQSDEVEGDPDQEFTEASLQLDILRDYQKALQETSPKEVEYHRNVRDGPEQDEAPTDDITDGLILSLTPSKPASPTPCKLHSPPPPPRLESGPDDITMTVALDDDTAMLKDFLNRAAASKAEKAAVTTHRRESLQNRRDSDVVRHALASPRKVLEEKDPNSPSKPNPGLTLDLSQALTLNPPMEPLSSPTPGATETEGADDKIAQSTRRSSRAKKSRLPAPASTGPAPAPKIAIRRNDGNDVVVLKKDDAKVLADLTRANTRKNKQGAFGVTVRLMKAQMEAMTLPPIDDMTKELIIGKNVRWDEQLAYYQENPDTLANALAEIESLATPDELGFSDTAPEPKNKTKKKKEKMSKTSTPKARRVKGLGTANGTPAKALTATASPSCLLAEAVKEEKEEAAQTLPKPKATKTKMMPVVASSSVDSSLSSTSSSSTKLPILDVAPVGISQPHQQPTQQRKSRLAAPKKVVLPTPAAPPGQGKENTALLRSRLLGDATPKKAIPAPKIAATATVSVGPGMESGLPRRRGRKY